MDEISTLYQAFNLFGHLKF